MLMAIGKYITYRKEKGELESCADGSDFINRLIKDRSTGDEVAQESEQIGE